MLRQAEEHLGVAGAELNSVDPDVAEDPQAGQRVVLEGDTALGQQVTVLPGVGWPQHQIRPGSCGHDPKHAKSGEGHLLVRNSDRWRSGKA